MSVMLRTTNPAVADEENPRDRRRPYVGQTVVFHIRPGEGRGGKTTAPAMVTHVYDDDAVELLIIYAADDFLTRIKIPRRTEQNPINAWSFNEWDEEHYLKPVVASVSPYDDSDLHDKIAKLDRELGVLRNIVAERVKK